MPFLPTLVDRKSDSAKLIPSCLQPELAYCIQGWWAEVLLAVATRLPDQTTCLDSWIAWDERKLSTIPFTSGYSTIQTHATPLSRRSSSHCLIKCKLLNKTTTLRATLILRRNFCQTVDQSTTGNIQVSKTKFSRSLLQMSLNISIKENKTKM